MEDADQFHIQYAEQDASILWCAPLIEMAYTMDVLYFLDQRLKLIRHFYETASPPFVEIKRRIEAGEPPFEPPYSEDGEPPFMQEWSQAKTELELLGRTCVSMLSDSLKLYFWTWEKNLWVEPPSKVLSERIRQGIPFRLPRLLR